MVQVRGGDYARLNHPKQSFTVEMPEGYLLDAPSLFNYPVDEFALQAEYSDPSMARAHAAWYVFEHEGSVPVPSNFVYVERNGSFFGLYRMSEKLDGTWRDHNGLSNSNFYKADGGWKRFPGFDPTGFDQKEGDPEDPILDEVRTLLALPPSPSKTQQLYDRFDVPNIVNFMALATVTQHVDQGPHNVLRYWLPAVGPTSVLLLRLIARMGLDVGAVEYRTVLVWDLNQALGIRGMGLNDPLFRTIRRLARFRVLVIDSQPRFEPWRVTVNAYVPVVPLHLRDWPEWLTTDHNTVLDTTPAISVLAGGSDSGVR